MDKPALTTPAGTTSVKPDNHIASARGLLGQNGSVHAIERASFEKALDQIRDRSNAAMAATQSLRSEDRSSMTEDADFKAVENSREKCTKTLAGSTEHEVQRQTHIPDGAALSEEVISCDCPSINPSTDVRAGNERVLLLTKNIPSLSTDVPGHISLTAMPDTSMANPGSYVSDDVTEVDHAVYSGSPYGEKVIARMNNIAHEIETTVGDWQFDVVDDENAMLGLHLQRSLKGSWKVNIAISNVEIDESQHAENLLSVLEREGYDIDSVIIECDTPGRSESSNEVFSDT